MGRIFKDGVSQKTCQNDNSLTLSGNKAIEHLIKFALYQRVKYFDVLSQYSKKCFLIKQSTIITQKLFEYSNCLKDGSI